MILLKFIRTNSKVVSEDTDNDIRRRLYIHKRRIALYV